MRNRLASFAPAAAGAGVLVIAAMILGQGDGRRPPRARADEPMRTGSESRSVTLPEIQPAPPTRIAAEARRSASACVRADEERPEDPIGFLSAIAGRPRLNDAFRLRALIEDVRLDAELRAEAAALAGCLADDSTEVRSLLLRAVSDRSSVLREGAVRGLSGCGGDEATAALLSALADPSPDVRASTARALGRRGDSRAAGPIAALARSAPHCEAYLDALGRIGGAEAEAALREIESSTRLPDVLRQRARDILAATRP